MVNILRPGNRFGKSLVTAGKHLYHAFTKINIQGQYKTVEQWEKITYNTLNFGPGYEQAREVLRLAKAIVQGEIHLPLEFQDKYGVTNDSKLKDWFIVSDRSEAVALPDIEFMSGVQLLGRSYSDMGAAFKMKAIAYASGDECGDIAELWTFTNSTLLPRLAQYRGGQIDFVGTPQAEGHDYMRMIEMAEEDMARPTWKEDGMFYVQKGSMLDNPFLPKETLKQLERIADPTIRRQIIEGEYVESGDKYYGYERVQNAIDPTIRMTDRGLPGRKYLVCCDFAGGESYWADFSVFLVIDYTEEPYKVVKFVRFKGGDVPIPMQYKMVEELYNDFNGDMARAKVIIDSSALGGKNATAFLKHIQPYNFDIQTQMKAEMMATLKIALDGGNSEIYRRKVVTGQDGVRRDTNPNWGIIKIPDIKEFVNELTNYKIDDKKIRTDTVMSLAMGIHYLEMRRPKNPKRGMVSFDLLKLI